MNEQKIWALEEQLWLEGVAVYDDILSSDCIMAFPAPTGILKGQVIRDSLEGIPRWKSIAMTEQVIGYSDNDGIVIAYKATAQRGDNPAYHAFCTSSYRFISGQWKIIHHQHTPID